jgi:hypothetical protein
VFSLSDQLLMSLVEEPQDVRITIAIRAVSFTIFILWILVDAAILQINNNLIPEVFNGFLNNKISLMFVQN